LADHVLDDEGLPVQSPNGNRLREMVQEQGHAFDLNPVKAPRLLREDHNPYVGFDPSICILCARCTRYCDEVEAVSAITLKDRGSATTISTVAELSLLDTTCELCGGCIDTCPTGAMFEKKAPIHAPEAVTKVSSTCNFCGVGCQLDLNVQDGKVVKVTSPPPGTTLNDGNLCVKGRFAYDFINHEERLQTPLIRGSDGQLHAATWEEALSAAATGLLAVKQKHGADSLGFVSSSRCTGEENYLVQKIARAAFGTNNCHSCAAT
jgi:predicted molibdopterin-dependent oxidoreductase YjgC